MIESTGHRPDNGDRVPCRVPVPEAVHGQEEDSLQGPQVPRFFQRSPIDLKDSIYHPFDLGQVEFLYPLTSVQGMTEGEPHHARVTVTNYVRIPLFGLKLRLQQIHFHAESEHLVSGVARPLELHLVHQIEGGQSGATVGSELLVIGVFFFASADAKRQRALPKIGEFLATNRKLAKSGGDWKSQTIEFDPNHCLPDLEARSRFFRYEGSLTSGELDERVSWLVFERPVPVLPEDLEPILGVAEQPQRPVDDLNRRYVLRSFP